MEAQWSVDLLSQKFAEFAEGGSKIIAIFHRETPSNCHGLAAKYDHSSFRCKVGVNMSSLDSIIMLSVNL